MQVFYYTRFAFHYAKTLQVAMCPYTRRIYTNVIKLIPIQINSIHIFNHLLWVLGLAAAQYSLFLDDRLVDLPYMLNY